MVIKKSDDSPAFSLFACDVDGDSVVMTPDTTKHQDYYFSDPHVIAVLQSAPYFNDLVTVNSNYITVGSTSITQSTGSSTGVNAGASVSAGIMFGFEEDLHAIVSVATVSVKNTLTLSINQEFETSKQTTKSFTFTAQATSDMVALVMTPLRPVLLQGLESKR